MGCSNCLWTERRFMQSNILMSSKPVVHTHVDMAVKPHGWLRPQGFHQASGRRVNLPSIRRGFKPPHARGQLWASFLPHTHHGSAQVIHMSELELSAWPFTGIKCCHCYCQTCLKYGPFHEKLDTRLKRILLPSFDHGETIAPRTIKFEWSLTQQHIAIMVLMNGHQNFIFHVHVLTDRDKGDTNFVLVVEVCVWRLGLRRWCPGWGDGWRWSHPIPVRRRGRLYLLWCRLWRRRRRWILLQSSKKIRLKV